MPKVTVTPQQLPPEILQGLANSVRIDASRLRGVELLMEGDMPQESEQWISVEQAAAKYHIDRTILIKLAKDGVIRASRPVRKPDDSLLLEQDVEYVTRRIAQRVKEKGEATISATEAATLCGVSVPTILNWVKKGHIRSDGNDPQDRRKVLVKRRDVELAAALVQLSGVAKGRYVFPASFRPA